MILDRAPEENNNNNMPSATVLETNYIAFAFFKQSNDLLIIVHMLLFS